MLTTTNLTKRFGTRTLWHDLNLEVHGNDRHHRTQRLREINPA